MKRNEILKDRISVREYAADNQKFVIEEFTDSISVFNGIKMADIEGKGEIMAAMAEELGCYLRTKGIEARFVERISSNEILCLKTEIIPLEIVTRNIVAGSMTERLGIEEGLRPGNTIYDLFYCSPELENPLINDHHAVALGFAGYDELDEMYSVARKVNGILSVLFDRAGIALVDFRLCFGKLPDGRIVAASEITPDTARFWDKETGERLDKDRFRMDMGKIGDSYRSLYQRMKSVLQ